MLEDIKANVTEFVDVNLIELARIHFPCSVASAVVNAQICHKGK
jgi:hypothetical protein